MVSTIGLSFNCKKACKDSDAITPIINDGGAIPLVRGNVS